MGAKQPGGGKWPEPVRLLSDDPNAKAEDDVRPKLANLHAYLEPQLGSWLKQCYERSRGPSASMRSHRRGDGNAPPGART
jgi:hypothetical protein